MKAVMVMFDSLNPHLLSAYGCDWTHTPNFRRLADRAATFDNCYVGSMPCMPARRELHTGRYNFLHRGWGPLEPFDDSMPQMLRDAGVSSHLVSDHYHYWEDGGCTYHTRYSTWQAFRGQEGDPWIGQVAEPEIPQSIRARTAPHWRQDWVNRQFLTREEDQPQYKTFAAGVDFIRRNHQSDNWLLHIETFDPHEPFFTQDKYKKLYEHLYKGRHFDWPPYGPVQETPEEIEHVRREYAALMSMCDEHLGKVLDVMDELDMWADTMLIVNTDHGFMLGEQDGWAKCWLPMYQEIAHTPLFIWDPRSGVAGQRRRSLVQTIDLAPTLLEFFGIDRTPDMQGRPLGQTIADDTPVRQTGLFGLFGNQVNLTDGRHVYMRAPRAGNAIFHHTLMPTHMNRMFTLKELRTAELVGPLSFTKGCQVVRTNAGEPTWGKDSRITQDLLWDVVEDPFQQRPITDAALEARMIDALREQLGASDAPAEMYARLGL